MNILALETCTAAGSVAVLRSSDQDSQSEKLVALNEWMRGRSHAEVMTPAMEDAVRIAGGWNTIDAVAVGIGPGSFTGIRVALNAGRAIAWSLGRPLIPIRSTDTLIEGVLATGLVPSTRAVLAVLNAQMGLVFASWIDSARRKSTSPIAISPEDLAKTIAKLKTSVTVIGDAADFVSKPLLLSGIEVGKLDSSLDFPHAATVARLALREIGTRPSSSLVGAFPWQSVQPLYIRGSGAEEKMG